MLSVIIFALAFCEEASALKRANIRMHLSTRTYCNKDVKDIHGNPSTCGKSMAMETYGLTLPGMDDGSVTVKEDMIVAKDGLVRVKAMPSRPFQFLMTTESTKTKAVHQLFNHQAIAILESEQDPDVSRRLAESPATLAEVGWTSEGKTTLDGATVNKYTKRGPQGVDKKTGANYTALYQTGMYPDLWTLYTDSADDKFIRMVAMNSFGGKTLQETDYSNHQQLTDDFDVTQATQEIYSTYKITSSRRLGEGDSDAPPVNMDFITADFIAEDERTYFQENQNVDWLNPASQVLLRGSVQGAGAGVPYFGITKGSASDAFFNHEDNRRMEQLVKFQFPKACRQSEEEQTQRYCLFVAVDATRTSFTLSAGVTFVDVQNNDNSAHLTLTALIAKTEGSPALNLTVDGGGCATVWQYGESFSINVVVCMFGQASGNDLLQPDNRTFTANIDFNVTFNVDIPVQGSIIHWAVEGKVNCTVAPKNVITVTGSLGTTVNLWVAGASVSIDIKGNTMDNEPNKWQFFSGVNLNAWVHALFYNNEWNWRWEIWHASPVYF